MSESHQLMISSEFVTAIQCRWQRAIEGMNDSAECAHVVHLDNLDTIYVHLAQST